MKKHETKPDDLFAFLLLPVHLCGTRWFSTIRLDSSWAIWKGEAWEIHGVNSTSAKDRAQGMLNRGWVFVYLLPWEEKQNNPSPVASILARYETSPTIPHQELLSFLRIHKNGGVYHLDEVHRRGPWGSMLSASPWTTDSLDPDVLRERYLQSPGPFSKPWQEVCRALP